MHIEPQKKRPKLHARKFYRKICHWLARPSFEGYFASKSGAFALSDGNLARSESTKTCGELQFHLQRMVTLLRTDDILRMAVRIESQIPQKKRYLALVTDGNDSSSAVLGIDWADRPTIGLILPIYGSSNVTLDGDGGFHITSGPSQVHMFKPVSVQTLWSAIQVTHKAIEVARRKNYFLGGSSHDLVKHYKARLDSEAESVTEWNLLEGIESRSSLDIIRSEQEEKEEQMIKKIIRQKLREVMLKVDLDDVTAKEIRMKVEEGTNLDLTEYKEFVDTEMLTILGQMDSASKILDYLYLGSEWNASNYDELVALGIGYVLNVTREIDNFFPGSFVYYNVRVWDVEESELLHHWDHTFRFINQARESGSKVLVHCRMGISRSASTVIAYLMKAEGWSLAKCMEHTRSCRSIIQPNPGFQKQLIIYEGILNSSRNRFSALFRQRSRSEGKRPTPAEQRRKMFRTSRDSKEVDEDIERTEAAGMPPGSANIPVPVLTGQRPKSWGGTPSFQDVMVDVGADVDVSRLESVSESMNKSTDSEPQSSDENIAGNLSDNGEELELSFVEQHEKKERAMTVPPINLESDEGDEESEKVAELRDVVKTGRRSQLKRQVTDADLDSLISEDAKEENESMMKQAFMASEMKNKLMRSLEQAGRTTKHKMDEEFSVESIVKPSSLRKLSKTRRLSVERLRSVGEQDLERMPMRQRSFTEVTPGSSNRSSDNNDMVVSDPFRRAHTLPHTKSRKKDLPKSEDLKIAIDFTGEGSDLVPSLDTLSFSGGSDSDVSPSLCTDAHHCSQDAKQSRNEEQEQLARRTQRYKAFLRRSKNNVKEDSRRRTLDERQLRMGLGELFKSRDILKNDEPPQKKEPLVVEDSQFTTVKESKKQIEERVRQHYSRIVRSPRRRTVGESELREQRKQGPSDGHEANTKPSTCQGAHDTTEEVSGCNDKVHCVQNRILDPPDSLPSPGRVRRSAQTFESANTEKGIKHVSQEPMNCDKVEGGCSDVTESFGTEINRNGEQSDNAVPINKGGILEDDISVRDLVKFHSDLIRQKSTSPSSGNSPTDGSPPYAISPTGEDSQFLGQNSTENDQPQSPRSPEPSGNFKSFSDESLKDPSLIGIVKRQAEVFAKAVEPLELPITRKRKGHTLPRGRRTCISPFKSFEHPVHEPLARGKSLPTSKSEGEMDFEVEAIFTAKETLAGSDMGTVPSQGASVTVEEPVSGLLLPLPSSDVCSKSAPPSPDCARRESGNSSYDGRSCSLESIYSRPGQHSVKREAPEDDSLDKNDEGVKVLVERFEIGDRKESESSSQGN